MVSIKEVEQRHMDAVITKVDKAKKLKLEEKRKANADKKEIDDSFSKNVRIKTATYSGMMETALTVRQQQQLLRERETTLRRAEEQIETLQKLAKKPYFARIDFKEEDEPKEKIYIGLASFADKPDHFLIYDWRAPISSIYYDGGGLGEVTYQTPDGLRKVDLTLKRQFMVEDGKILTVFDTDETLGDQMLLEVLDDASDIKMKTIVTTIQKEQNKIIRDVDSKLLFVQGAAGSGKTSAILQRIAFLLYRYRGNLNSSQVILFSPNQLFNDYIDQVLPELGEQNMIQMTYFQYTNRRIPKLKVETLKERFENENGTTDKLVKLKGSLEFFKATTRYTKALEKNGMQFRDLKLNGKAIISKDRIKKIYYSFNENYNLLNRLDATKERLYSLLNSMVGREAKTDRVQKAIQTLTKQELTELYEDKKAFTNGDKELEFLSKQYVKQELKPIYKMILRNAFFNVNAQYIHFLKNIKTILNLSKAKLEQSDWDSMIKMTILGLKERNLAMVDVTPYLYIYDKITGKRGNTDIKYVFIDEIQDYTPYQLAFLKNGFPRAKFTMLGDLNQAIFTHENSKSLLEELRVMFPKEKTKVVKLTKSYRSTKPITDFTKEILVNGEAVTSFAREGQKPKITITKTRAEMLEGVLKQLRKNNQANMTTAIIAKSIDDCESLAKYLNNKEVKATLIKTENQRLVEGTLVIPAYLAKGLEFDAVIMFDADDKNYNKENQRQLVYTICSRAMHRLDIFALKKLSPLFKRVPNKLYTLQKYS